ncbi:uncharacterized mitochondrial protein AtMg00820-like [Humulus lupulus]|uniref:uncharacterized mitochondrial protein AtMg00820-like n=1 Tax=Humulus lupulus TaxID=3486 RepID=UPI002B402F59|nr:uncharacterized mitochondrial protein AtMg00820-like [Humulus lupulus]
MTTRAKAGVYKPKVHITSKDPLTVEKALSKLEWHNAMAAKLLALKNNRTWSLVELPKGRKARGCRWVFKLKENLDGTIDKYKARLVAKGFRQQYGFDFTETFSLVVRPTTIRVILTIALSR